MSEQQETILPSKVTPSRPTTNDSTAWSMYWHALGQKWRTEPEIDDERQKALFNLLTTISPGRPHMYPFLAVKLTRAEVEWLIANPPVDKEKYLELLKKILEDKEKLRKLSKQQFVDLRREVYDIASSSQTIDLRGADLRGVALSNLPLSGAWLEDADLSSANLRGAFLHGAHLERAILDGALLENTSLSGAHLEFASLAGAHLERASLRNAHLEGAVLTNTHLEGACLVGTFFDSTTKLDDIHLSSKYHGSALIGDVHWDDADLSGVNWEQLAVLGDEQRIQQIITRRKKDYENHPDKKTQYAKMFRELNANLYKAAARAYHRLAVTLQEQGLAEEAIPFAYRSQVLQRIVFRQQRKFGQYLFSLFLDILSGYGYKPGRSFLAYACIIGVFAISYHVLGPRLAWNEAIVISMTAFHGRGFFPGTFSPGDPLAFASALEAFVGLIIEVTFIGTLTRRLFGR